MKNGDLKPSTAIVVYSNTAQLGALSKLARKAGLESTDFPNVESALAAMDPNNPPALIVTGLCMPGIDGWSFCRLLRSKEYAAFNQVPILVVSAVFAGDEAEYIALNLGAEAVICSPLDDSSISERIQSILSGERKRVPLRVLIVEGSEILAHTLKKAFIDDGHQADTAFTAKDAVEAFAKDSYDAAVLECHLNGGMEDSLLCRLRATRPGCICIMISNDLSPELALDWMKRGAAACLHKPFEPEYLLDLCARIMRERALLHVDELFETCAREQRESEERYKSYDGLIHDITAHKQVEEAVRASEAKYRQLVELAQEGIWSIDQNENTTYVNPRMAEMLGYSVDEMIGKHLFSFMDEAGKTIVDKQIKQRQQGIPGIFDFEFIGKNGQRILTRLSVTPIIGHDGVYQGDLAVVIDITAHRKAERDYQTLFREMLNGFALHEMIYDGQGRPKDYRFLAVNPAFERMTGLKAKDIIGKTIKEVLPDIEPHWIETYGKVALSGEPVHFENVANPLGNFYDVTAFRPAPNQFACIFADITERNRAEEALQRERDRLNRIVETSPAGIAIMNQQGFITYANKQAEAVLGLTKDTIAQRTYNSPDWQITDFAGNPFPDDKLPFRQIMATGQPAYDVRHAIKWPDGRQALFSINAAPLFDPSGSINEIVATIEDITEQKRTEAQLQQSHHQYQQLVDHASDGIFTLNIGGAFLFVNEGLCKMLGYSREEMLCLNIIDTYPDEMRNEGLQRLNNISGGVTFQFERPMKRKDGSFISIEANVWITEDYYYQAIVRDITERKKAEEARQKLQEQLRQAQRMEVIGQLAGGVAHDFNNMLSAIMMNIGLAETFPNLDPRIKQAFNDIQSDASRAANLTRQLLLFSRRSVMNMKLLNINDVVAGMLKMLERLIGENIKLQFGRNDSLPAVKADAGMIEQVLMNLVVNARDAMPKGGTIMISIDAFDVSSEQIQDKLEVQPGQFICLSISDTGCGMDEDIRKHIFEPFFTTKEPGKGTGLGLATVYGIVAQHRGWVEVLSETGKGATFRIFLPANPESISDSTQSEKKSILRGHETILLVEDAQSLRQMMVQGLRSLGYHVIEASDGQAALQKWEAHHQQIDMLFSDMVMPEGLTGLDLAESFLNAKPVLKVIISSGYSAETAEKAKLSARNIIFLQKPYGIGVMAKAIRDSFEK